MSLYASPKKNPKEHRVIGLLGHTATVQYRLAAAPPETDDSTDTVELNHGLAALGGDRNSIVSTDTYQSAQG